MPVHMLSARLINTTAYAKQGAFDIIPLFHVSGTHTETALLPWG